MSERSNFDFSRFEPPAQHFINTRGLAKLAFRQKLVGKLHPKGLVHFETEAAAPALANPNLIPDLSWSGMHTRATNCLKTIEGYPSTSSPLTLQHVVGRGFDDFLRNPNAGQDTYQAVVDFAAIRHGIDIDQRNILIPKMTEAGKNLCQDLYDQIQQVFAIKLPLDEFKLVNDSLGRVRDAGILTAGDYLGTTNSQTDLTQTENRRIRKFVREETGNERNTITPTVQYCMAMQRLANNVIAEKSS